MATTTKKRRATTTKSGSINKAEEIRKAAKELGGKKVRPKDVIEALAAKGITVSSPQVSSTLKAAGYRKTRRKVTASAKSNHSSASTELSVEHLLAAKALVGKLGSVEAAQKALAAWSKLM